MKGIDAKTPPSQTLLAQSFLEGQIDGLVRVVWDGM
jgi:hypothetical protein